jgi:uncharacterized membrane protein YfcA
MPGKSGEKITLEMIEEHLRKQDIEFARSLWFALLAFAGSVVIGGGIFWLSSKDPGIFIYGVAFFLIILALYSRWERKSKKP